LTGQNILAQNQTILMGKLKAQSNRLLYSNAVIDGR